MFFKGMKTAVMFIKIEYLALLFNIRSLASQNVFAAYFVQLYSISVV